MFKIKLIKKYDLVIIPLVYVVFGFFLYLNQDKFIYIPDNRPHGECSFAHEDTMVIDDAVVRGYYARASDPKGVVVHYHGNAGNACDRKWYLPFLINAGWSVFLVEYPGYADPDHKPNTNDILDSVIEIGKYINDKNYQRLAIIGESIGAGPGSWHATKYKADTLILITSFERLSSRAQRAVWIYPASLMLKRDMLVDKWAQSAPSVLIIAAERDTVIPLRHTKRLYESLDPEITTFKVIKGTTHNTLYSHPKFMETIVQHLQQLP